MGTLTTINMYWQHGRSVTEIWGKDEIKNVECAPRGGGGRNKEFRPFWGRNLNMVMHTQKA